jgi:hypothetical protein
MDIEILNLQGPSWEEDWGGVKRTRYEPIGIVIHICMQTSQGISLCSYRHFKLITTSCSSFYLLFLFSTKSENRRLEQVLWGGEFGTNRGVGKGVGG